MGRHAEGWKVVWRRGIAYVRFTHAKTRFLISTGQRDSEAARVEAARLYSDTVKGGKRKPAGVVRSLAPLKETLAEWVASLHGTMDPETVDTYELYAFTHWAKFFGSLGEVTDSNRIEAYGVARLRVVLRSSVRKERSALRGFLRWCKVEGLIAEMPEWPELPSKAKGKRAGKQRQKANQLTPAQVVAFIAALPEWSERKDRRGKGTNFPVRPRYDFAYQTGLRPATLDLASWEDWKGTTLSIDDADDKARFGRDVPLSEVALAVLRKLHVEMGEPTTGLIFGRHDYRSATKKACLKAGIDLKVAPYDFRHARGTHLVDDGASLGAVAYMLGHTQLTTTNKYAKGTQRAAEAALAKEAHALRGAAVDELRGVVGDVLLGDVRCDPTPPSPAPEAADPEVEMPVETRLPALAVRRAAALVSGSILDPETSFAVRRRGLEPLRELPHWNLKPATNAETPTKQACRHFESTHDAAEKRTESHRSGSRIHNLSALARAVFQTQSGAWFQLGRAS